jgi:hypothetical protein
VPAQSVSPAWQESAQLPPEQAKPAAQAVAQVPQWSRSVDRSAQTPPQLDSLVGQAVTLVVEPLQANCKAMTVTRAMRFI